MKNILKGFQKVLLIFIFSFFFFIFSSSILYAAECNGSGVDSCTGNTTCSCNQTIWDNTRDPDAAGCHCAFKPDNQVECNHTICPVGYICTGKGTTSWCEKPSGGPAAECPWSQSNCPSGTIIDLTQPINKFDAKVSRCPGPGTAQRETGVCAHTVKIPAGPPVCEFRPAYNKTVCEPSTPEESFCGSREIQNYACKPIATPIPPVKPTLTPTPIPTRIPVPLKCESLKGELGGLGGVPISSTNTSNVKFGDKISFTASTNSNGTLVKSMTFQVVVYPDGGAPKIVLTQDMPAKSANGVWTATYEYLFNTYGKVQVSILAITPQ